MTLALRQTMALLIDAVRRLRAAKLFWITLGLSLLVAASFGLVGINSVGLHFPFYGTLQNGLLNTTIIPADAFYKLMFLVLGVSIWLSWASIILALISTADLIPSLASDGSADLYLSRPVGRVRLLLTRYTTGLLFAAAQAACFSVAAIFVIGLRGGVWLPALLWTIPAIVVFFSFLYCVSALVGLSSRNSIAAILATLLVWFFSWGVDTADQALLQQREQAAVEVEYTQFDLEQNAQLQSSLREASEIARSTAAGNGDALQRRLDDQQASLSSWQTAHNIVMWVKTPLPKTGETIEILNDRLISATDLQGFSGEINDGRIERSEERAERMKRDVNDTRRREQMQIEGESRAGAAYSGRSWWWSLGTSFLFQAVLVAIACWMFARRDL